MISDSGASGNEDAVARGGAVGHPPSAVLDAIRDCAVIELDLEGAILGWNRGATEIFGYSKAEICGAKVSVLHVPSAQLATDVAMLLNTARDAGHATGVGWRLAKNGCRLWVNASINAIYDDSGVVTGFVKLVRDATIQFETSERQRALIESTAYAVIATTTDGTIKVFNQAAERLLGYSAIELVDVHTLERFHDAHEVTKRAAELSFELGRRVLPGFDAFSAWTRERRLPDERLWTYVRKDGSRLPALVSITALRDPHGEIAGYLVIARDMTEINRARRELAEHEQRLRVIFEGSLDGTFLISDEGAILDLNPMAERIFGYTKEELEGQNIRLLLPLQAAGSQRLSFEPLGDGVRRAVIGVVQELRARRRDGSQFPVDVSLNDAFMDSKRVLVGTVRDISARKATEVERDRLRRLIEATSDFVSMSDPHGNLIYQNPAGNELIGWQPDASVKGKRIADVHPKWAADWILEHAFPMATREGSCSYETTLLHSDGTEIPVSQVLMVHKDANGRVEYASTIMRDLRAQKQAEALLSKVASQVQGMLYQLELQPNGTLRFPYASAGAYELYGLTPEELARDGVILNRGLSAEEAERLQRSIAVSARDLTPWLIEYQYTRRDGAVRWHRARSVPERQANGVTLWHGFVADITEERAATDEVQRAKTELEEAIAAMDAGFAMFDAEERLVICNDRYAEIYQVPDRVRNSRPRYEDMIRACIGERPELTGFLPPGIDFEARLLARLEQFRNPQGQSVQHHGSRWVRVDERKTSTGGTACMRTDITGLKQAEFQARIQQQRLTLAANSAELGIWDYDPNSDVLVWDERMFEIHGLTKEQFPGTRAAWRETVHHEDLETLQVYAAESLRLGRDMRSVFRIVRPDGGIRHVDSRGTYLRGSDGAITRVVGVMLDITVHVEAQETLKQAVLAARAATKAKAEFLATMSHEIRTPMNGVIGMTNLLMTTRLDNAQREYVETIRSSGESLLTLINDILDFSKMEAGKLELEETAFSLEQAVMESINLFTTQAELKGISLVPRLSPLPSAVLGDPVRFRQVLLNLISNALKFTKEGAVTVSVDILRTTSSRVTVEMRVTDTGIGMSTEHLSRLGEAFLQADASTTRQFGGTGLGLSICRTLIQLMQGTLTVVSELGVGTTFEVMLPMEVSSAALPSKGASVPSLAATKRLSCVLVAEDNVVNQRIVSLMLRNFADRIDIAADGREALEKFKTHTYDCVLMDGQMPEMDGLEATRQIRIFELETGRRRTPIIALTANALPGDREAFLGAGMDEYLTKPIRPGDLAAALARVNVRKQAS